MRNECDSGVRQRCSSCGKYAYPGSACFKCGAKMRPWPSSMKRETTPDVVEFMALRPTKRLLMELEVLAHTILEPMMRIEESR